MKFAARLLLITLAAVLVSGQAHAQGKSRPGMATESKGPTEADRQNRMAKEEQAAKAAMKNVPDSKEKYDPWKIGK